MFPYHLVADFDAGGMILSQVADDETVDPFAGITGQRLVSIDMSSYPDDLGLIFENGKMLHFQLPGKAHGLSSAIQILDAEPD